MKDIQSEEGTPTVTSEEEHIKEGIKKGSKEGTKEDTREGTIKDDTKKRTEKLAQWTTAAVTIARNLVPKNRASREKDAPNTRSSTTRSRCEKFGSQRQYFFEELYLDLVKTMATAVTCSFDDEFWALPPNPKAIGFRKTLAGDKKITQGPQTYRWEFFNSRMGPNRTAFHHRGQY